MQKRNRALPRPNCTERLELFEAIWAQEEAEEEKWQSALVNAAIYNETFRFRPLMMSTDNDGPQLILRLLVELDAPIMELELSMRQVAWLRDECDMMLEFLAESLGLPSD